MKTAQSSSGRALRIGADGAIPWPHEKQPRARLAELIARAAVIAVTGGLASVACPVGVGRAHAADFYVNNSSASCSDAGPGTQDAPFCTISAALAAHHDPGTTINVMPGRYREQVTVPASGASGSPITFKALSSSNGPVIVDGTDDFSDPALWVQYSGDVWLASSVSWAPVQVFADDARLTPSTASPSALPPKSFVYVAGSGLYVNAGGGNPGSHQTQVGHRLYGFYASGKTWVAIDGFTVTRCEDRCIQLSNSSSNIDVLGNTVSLSGRFGMQASGCSAIRIAGNRVFDNAHHGISLVAGTTGATIEDNESFRNAHPTVRQANGLYLFGCPGNVIQRNRWHDNQDTGEQIQNGSNNNVSLQNLSWNNGDHGYDHCGSTGNIHIGDVAYGNYKDGFSFECDSPGSRVFNCIAVENGLTTNEFDLWVEGTSTSGFESNDNLFWNSTSQPPVKYDTTLYSSVADYSAASGQDTRTKQADPRFAHPGQGDFHLLAGSPAIDDANSGAPDWPATDAEGHSRSDDPGTPNTGLGPVPYADRGALEFQGTSAGNQPPVAKLTVTPSSGVEPLNVTADASGSSDPDGTIASYRFDFGDGTVVGPQSGATATHTYAAGNWTAQVTVTDDKGATGTASATVTVTRAGNQPPVAKLTVTPSSGVEPLHVTADASGSSDPDGTIASYRFDFGDGTVVGPQSGATATHTYAAGNWTAQVTVTDDKGTTGTASAAVTVTRAGNQPPVAKLTVTPSSGVEPLHVTADASGSSDPDGTIASYRFDFGDGTVVGPQSGATATHTYAAGNWTARVTVTDGQGATGTASATVTVARANQPPVAKLTVVPSSGPAPLATVASAVGSYDPEGTTLTYRFDFGDGTVVGPQSLPTAAHVYGAGNWTATVTVTDAGGATGSASAAVTATSLLLIAASSGGLGVASAQGQAIQPMEGVSARVTPNPVRGDAHLMFTTSRAGLVTVRIFDLRGRVVRRPWDGIIASAGEHVVPLGARDGGSMRAGIYYFEVRSPDGVKAGRFVILK